MSQATKQSAAKPTSVRLTVPLTQHGITAARARLAAFEQDLRKQARSALKALTDKTRSQSRYTRAQNIAADVETAREELWREQG